MEVTVQDDEERPRPPPPPEEQSTNTRQPRIDWTPRLELAESIVDSVLAPCASEVSRLSKYIMFIVSL